MSNIPRKYFCIEHYDVSMTIRWVRWEFSSINYRIQTSLFEYYAEQSFSTSLLIRDSRNVFGTISCHSEVANVRVEIERTVLTSIQISTVKIPRSEPFLFSFARLLLISTPHLRHRKQWHRRGGGQRPFKKLVIWLARVTGLHTDKIL